MELDSAAVHHVLVEKQIDALHHANTVQTSCLFLQHGRLLSRGAAEDRGVTQTPQRSDSLDKRYGIWNDIFLDSVDIHHRASSRNLYGPVLFRFSIDLLLDVGAPTIWITRMNPTDWKDGDRAEDRYYSSVEQFSAEYSKGDFRSMLMLRHVGGVVPLRPHLRDILVDGPGLWNDGEDLYSHTVGALRLSAWQGGDAKVQISKRECSSLCKCNAQYNALLSKARNSDAYQELERLFVFGSDA